MTDCSWCGKELNEFGLFPEEIFRVICTNKQNFRVIVYYYCSQCFKELSSEFIKKYGKEAMIEQ